MPMLPTFFNNLIDLLVKLHSVSRRQAEKITFNLASNPDLSKQIAAELELFTKKIKLCKSCHILNDRELCAICADPNRKSVLVIVETSLDVIKFEEIETFKPYYYILGGLVLINRQKKMDFSQVNIGNLKERISGVSEVILALSPNMEGIVTANYLRALLEKVKVTQLANGIPLGGAIDYIDKFTLQAALDNRKDMV